MLIECIFRLPAAITVRLIITTWSQKSGTEPKLWVETKIKWPSARNWRRSSTMAFSVLTSTPVKGSSSKIILLCCANARAKNTRFSVHQKARRFVVQLNARCLLVASLRALFVYLPAFGIR